MKLTVCIPTFNEELNIKKCLKKIKWANKIIIFDSKSSDKTINIAKTFKNTKIINAKKKLDYVSKLNYLLRKTKNMWVLFIDADYVLSDKLVKKIRKLDNNYIKKNNINGFKIPIYNKIFGKIIKENIYPKKILLFKNSDCYFKRIGHAEKLLIKKKNIFTLKEFILHENLNDIENFKLWKLNQIKYSKKDAKRIIKTKFSNLRIQDKIRRLIPINIFLILIYLLTLKKIFFYGYAGFFYLYQRIFYEFTLSFSILKIYLRKIKIFFSF